MNSRNALTLSLAIAAALSAPFAFAQDAQADAQDAAMQDQAAMQTAQDAQDTQDPQAQADADASAVAPTPQHDATAAQNTSAEPASDAKKITWSELDGDKDGALSKSEVAPVDSLSKAFDVADADKDGTLTADEYKAYVAVHSKIGADGNG